MTVRIGGGSAILDTQIYGMFQYDADTSTGLTFGYTAGIVNPSGTNPVDVAAGTVVLADNDTNFVYLTGSSVAAGTTVATDAIAMMYEVVTSGGAVTTITDLREVY